MSSPNHTSWSKMHVHVEVLLQLFISKVYTELLEGIPWNIDHQGLGLECMIGKNHTWTELPCSVRTICNIEYQKRSFAYLDQPVTKSGQFLKIMHTGILNFHNNFQFARHGHQDWQLLEIKIPLKDFKAIDVQQSNLSHIFLLILVADASCKSNKWLWHMTLSCLKCLLLFEQILNNNT